jgi:UDP-2,3-diacylglucosamine pyrophosphatase LpxH
MIIIGDIHGDFHVLEPIIFKFPDQVIIQVGDFGFWPLFKPRWSGPFTPIYFIDGNHDYIPGLPINGEGPEEVWPGAIYVPRGVVLELEGKRVLFLGGSKSVDRAWRVKDSINHGWFEDEQLNEAQVQRALANGPVDLMITHTPPDFLIRSQFSPMGLRSFGHDPDKWIDESSRNVERVWRELGEPMLFCGHMHRSVIHPKIRILDINEVVEYGKG